MKKIILVILFLFIILGCTGEKAQIKSPNVKPNVGAVVPTKELVFKAGQSFGMCTGYCFKEVEITKEKTSLNMTVFGKGSYMENYSDKYPDIIKNFSTKEWNELNLLYKSEQEIFLSLPEVIGCPDCTDGGTGWIEVSDGKTTKRTAYDLMSFQPEEDKLKLTNLKFVQKLLNLKKDLIDMTQEELKTEK